MIYPRTDKDYIYEEFVNTNDGNDIKFYVVAPSLIHAESRKYLVPHYSYFILTPVDRP